MVAKIGETIAVNYIVETLLLVAVGIMVMVTSMYIYEPFQLSSFSE